MRRVVVTGLGLLTPLGIGVELNWRRLNSGSVGIKKINDFEVSDLPCKIAGQIPSIKDDNEGGLDLDNWIEPREYKRIDRFIAYGIISAVQAVEDSGWTPKTENEKQRTGVILGSGIGGINTLEKQHQRLLKSTKRVSPYFVPSMISDIAPGHISIKYGFKGTNFSENGFW